MNNWEDLSITEKAAIMKSAVKNGVTNLQDIRREYNEFSKGGSKKKSSVNPTAQRAMRYFMDKGLTDYQAAGLVGNLMRESGISPTALNSSSGAYGLAQWLGARKKALFNKYGKNPTLDNQLDFIWSELNSSHRNGLRHLKASKNATEAARNAMGYYEFSVGPEGAVREMKKYGQDGEGSMRKGISNASILMGQPVPAYTPTQTQSSAPRRYQGISYAESIPDEIEFTPSNLEAFFAPIESYRYPDLELATETEDPLIEAANAYSQEALEREQRMDNLSKLNMLLGMTGGSNGNSYLNTLSMLANTFAKGGSTDDTDLVDWIIKEEGFNKKPEDIGDGKMTLDSGLTSKKWHDLYRKRGNKWSAEDNRMAVAEEVANRRRWAEKTIPNWEALPDSSQKALLSYKYNYDFTPTNSPKLFKALADSNFREAARQMDATSKDPKFKEGLMKRRLREQEWFLSDLNNQGIPNPPAPAVISTPVTVNTSMPQIVAPAVSTAVANNYVPATIHPYTRMDNARRAIDAAAAFNKMMEDTNIQNNMSEYQFPIEYAKGGGIEYSYTKPLDNVYIDSEGNVLDPSVPSAKGTIRTPDVVIATRDPRKAVPTANSLNTSNIESTVKEAIKNYFVGNLSDDEVRRRLYHNLAPYGYTRTIARLESAIKNNTSHEFDRRHKNDRDRQDIWAEYLGIPEEERKALFDSSTSILRDSQYSPTVGKEQNIKYKAISNPSEADVRDLIQHAEVLPIGKNKVVAGGIGHALGRYTIGHNYDNKGEYVSYYDKWDLNPFSNAGEDLSLGIGKPVNIYDRIYLDDYYGIPKEYRGSTYIPELTVTANKHANGGKIHIKPSHRGRLTELKKRTGKSEAELYKTGGPAVRKMITFARSARKWNKHDLGGYL